MRLPIISISICASILMAVMLYETPNIHFLPTNINYNSLTQPAKKQIDCLAENIYFEAAHEPTDGKIAVAMVTLNRVISGRYADTICDVVYQKIKYDSKVVCQFSWVCEDGPMSRRLTIRGTSLYNEIRDLSVRVFLNYDRMRDVTHGATYYHADYVNPGWKLPITIKIGRHIFYKKTGDLENKSKEINL